MMLGGLLLTAGGEVWPTVANGDKDSVPATGKKTYAPDLKPIKKPKKKGK